LYMYMCTHLQPQRVTLTVRYTNHAYSNAQVFTLKPGGVAVASCIIFWGHTQATHLWPTVVVIRKTIGTQG